MNSNKHSTAGQLHIVANGIVHVITAGVTIAAIHFSRIAILWFYLIPLIGVSVNFKEE
jgi:hypothetical protein